MQSPTMRLIVYMYLLWCLVVECRKLRSYHFKMQPKIIQLSSCRLFQSQVSFYIQVGNLTGALRQSALKQLSTYDWMDSHTKETAKMKVSGVV